MHALRPFMHGHLDILLRVILLYPLEPAISIVRSIDVPPMMQPSLG